MTGEAVQWCVLGSKHPDLPDPNIVAREYLDPPPQLNTVVIEKCTTVPYYKIINGTYRPTGINYNGKELFRKVVKLGDPDIWLHFQNRDKCNDWRVTELLGSEQFERCVSNEKNLDSPVHVKKWLCKTEYQSGGYEEANAKMACKYLVLQGEKKKKAVADAMRRRLGGNRPLGVDRSASKMQEASGGRAVHDVPCRATTSSSPCAFVPGGIYEGTKHENGRCGSRCWKSSTSSRRKLWCPRTTASHPPRKKGGGCSNYRPPASAGQWRAAVSEERQDVCETRPAPAGLQQLVWPYTACPHSSIAEKRVLHFESPRSPSTSRLALSVGTTSIWPRLRTTLWSSGTGRRRNPREGGRRRCSFRRRRTPGVKNCSRNCARRSACSTSSPIKLTLPKKSRPQRSRRLGRSRC